MRASCAMPLKAHRSAGDFSAEPACGVGDDVFWKRECHVRDRSAVNAAKMRVRWSGRFVVCAVRPGKRDLSDETHVAETSKRPIDGRKSNSGAPRPCQFVEFGHGQVASNPLLLDDIVYQSMVFREPALVQFDGVHGTSEILSRCLGQVENESRFRDERSIK